MHFNTLRFKILPIKTVNWIHVTVNVHDVLMLLMLNSEGIFDSLQGVKTETQYIFMSHHTSWKCRIRAA